MFLGVIPFPSKKKKNDALESKAPISDPHAFLDDASVIAFLRRVIARKLSSPEEAEDCFGYFLERLLSNEGHMLRTFSGKAKRSTYLTTLANRVLIDFQRSRYGRNVGRKNAGSQVPDAVADRGGYVPRLWSLLFTEGYDEKEAFSQLNSELEEPISDRELHETAEWLADYRPGGTRQRSYISVEAPDAVNELQRQPQVSPEDEAMRRAESEHIARAMACLEPQERVIVEAVVITGTPMNQVAASLNITGPTVRRRLDIALSKMKDMLSR